MKKLITICITFALALSLIPAAFADWDLSDLTFDDLIALRAQIQLEMMSRGEWEEVEVPQGVYKVGEDIPAGKWTLRAMPGGHTNVRIGTELRDAGTDVKAVASETIEDAAYSYYQNGDKTEWTVDLQDGQYVVINYGPAVFTTYAGKPSLGFKALS